MMRVWLRIPAVCRDKIAVGTYCRLVCRISSPKPGSIFWQTASVASGVTSLIAGPVPPVVMIKSHLSISINCMSSDSMLCWLSSMIQESFSQGEVGSSVSV